MRTKNLRAQWLSATATATALIAGVQIYLTVMGVAVGISTPSFEMLVNNLGLTALAGMILAILIILDTRKEN